MKKRAKKSSKKKEFKLRYRFKVRSSRSYSQGHIIRAMELHKDLATTLDVEIAQKVEMDEVVSLDTFKAWHPEFTKQELLIVELWMISRSGPPFTNQQLLERCTAPGMGLMAPTYYRL